MLAILLWWFHSAALAGGCEPAETMCDGLDDDCNGSIDEAVCGCTVAVNAGRAYLLCTNQRAWTAARDYCRAREPYRLATISSAAEDAWLDATLDAVSTSQWWFGFNDRVVEGTWGWVDGSDVTYTNWQSGEPNDQGTENCGELNRFAGGTWNDQSCGGSRRFVCEASGDAVTWYPDGDGDGWGDSGGATVTSSDPVAGHVDEGGDCEDIDADVHPNAPDPCYDDLDADCDGWNDYDCDGDGFVSEDHPGTAGGTSTGEGDCDDADALIVPGPDCPPEDTGDTGSPDTGDTGDTGDTDTADTDTADTSDTGTDSADPDTDVGFFTGGGCSCGASPGPLGGLLGLALAALTLRRRRTG